jgi:peptide/nickel transport system permease protein
LGWFPIAGYEPGWAGIRYLALPAFSMALMPAALLYRIIAGNLDSAAEEPSFLAGRALGLPLSLLRNKYALRLSLVSAATVAGNILIMFLAGALFSEYAFSIPGIGLLTVNAIANGDVPLIQGTVLAGSLTYAASHFLTEVLYWLVDPRVRG